MTYLKISQAHADSDKVCVTIQDDDGTYIRVEVNLSDFALTMLNGNAMECQRSRWRLPLAISIKP